MAVVGTIARIALGLVFVVAGATKLAAGRGWTTQAAAMGAPAVIVPAVPWAELALGAALVTGLLAPLPAIAAELMLIAFTALIVCRLAADEHPPCACYGAWSARPLGAGHVARNTALVGVAVLAVWG